MAGLTLSLRLRPRAGLLAAAIGCAALLGVVPLPAHAADEAVPASEAVVQAAPPEAPKRGALVAEAIADVADAAEQVWKGEASWYGPGLHGRPTASGERFDREAMTAAHPSLPFGTIVRVEHVDSGRSVDVRINDRGPFVKQRRSRIIDLSEAAARVLGLGRRAGVAPVRITIVQQERR